jgi:hypothetical protein
MATLGLSIVMFTAGLILRFAVTATVADFDFDAAGNSLIVVGVFGLIVGGIELFLTNGADRR